MKILSKLVFCSVIFLFSGFAQSDGITGTSQDEVAVDADADALAAQTNFIGRFYLNILNRVADQGGLDGWLNIIQSESGAKVAFGFFNSPEFLNLQLSNSDFVSILYSTLFDRLADQDGLDSWMIELESGSLRDFVIYGFLRSPEFSNLANSFNVTAFSEEDNKLFQIKGFVRRFYQLVLGREPEVTGLDEWSSQLSLGLRGGGEIALGFFGSQEFINRNTLDSEFVDIAYRAFFDREADEEGKNGWLDLLSTGTTRIEVVQGFIGSQEFIALAASFGIEATIERFTLDIIQNKTFYMVDESVFEEYVVSFQETTYTVTEPGGSIGPDSAFFIDPRGVINMGSDRAELKLKLAPDTNADFLQTLAIWKNSNWEVVTEQFVNQFNDITELKDHFLSDGLLQTNITSDGVVRKYNANTMVNGKWWIEGNTFYFDYPVDGTGGLESKAYKIENGQIHFASNSKYSHKTKMYYDDVKASDYFEEILATAQLGQDIKDICTIDNFTLGIVNSLKSEGLSLELVSQLIGCTFDPELTRVSPKFVAYSWKMDDLSRVLTVYFDPTGELSSPLNGTLFTATTGF